MVGWFYLLTWCGLLLFCWFSWVMLWQHGAFVTFEFDVLSSLINSGEDKVGPCWIFYFYPAMCTLQSSRLLHIADFPQQLLPSTRGKLQSTCVLIPLFLNVAMLGWDWLIDVFYFLPSDMHYAIPMNYAIPQASWFFCLQNNWWWYHAFNCPATYFVVLAGWLFSISFLPLRWQINGCKKYFTILK